ncbi:MAG: glycosyltransferase family 9 protein [Acidobacteria bacterium]|nr:glycosyltransferase family 9 protein [Acidobacteriota bacterium]
MTPPALEQLSRGARVLVVRLRSLGDCVLTTPALHLLKQHRPDLEIGVVVEDRFSQVYEGNPDIAETMPPSKRQVLRFRAELTLNLHGGARSAALTALSLARWRAGFAHFRQGWVYNVRIPRAQEILGEERTVHTAEHLASAMFYLGVPRTEIPRARLFAEASGRNQPYALVHPMASAAAKTWPAERFLAVCRHLKEASGLAPVVIGGTGDDLSAFDGFETLRGAPLSEVKALMAGASLFVGNDSGPAHMAAAFGVPVVVLYGPESPVIWAPWRTENVKIEAPQGLEAVTVETVIEAVEGLRGARR